MAAGSKQKHLSLSFATDTESFYSESSETLKVILFLVQELFSYQKRKG